MKKISKFENDFFSSKDIYNFSRSEIIDMISYFASSSISSLNVYLSIIRKYIDFAINKERLKTIINMTNNIDIDDLKNIINKTKQKSKIIGRNELYEIVTEKIYNYQDRAIILLIFEGLNLEEISNLKDKDINFKENTIEYDREYKESGISNVTRIKRKVPNRIIDILTLARKENEYLYNNAVLGMDINGNPKKQRYGTFMDKSETEYYIRPLENRSSITRKLELDATKTPPNTLRNRLLKVFKVYLDMPYITPTDIYRAGVLYRLDMHLKANKMKGTHVNVQNFLDLTREAFDIQSMCVSYREMTGLE